MSLPSDDFSWHRLEESVNSHHRKSEIFLQCVWESTTSEQDRPRCLQLNYFTPSTLASFMWVIFWRVFPNSSQQRLADPLSTRRQITGNVWAGGTVGRWVGGLVVGCVVSVGRVHNQDLTSSSPPCTSQ